MEERPKIHVDLKRRLLAFAGAVALAGILTGCRDTPNGCAKPGAGGTVNYQACVARYESIAGVATHPPFTVLTIDYYKPGRGGYYFPSTEDRYLRVLRGNDIVVKKAEMVQRWEGLGRNVLLATVEMLGDGGLHLIDAAPGAPVSRHVATGENGWDQDKRFEQGYPWGPGRRYLPRRYRSTDNGFLLSVDPFRLQTLPETPEGMTTPYLRTLAAVSPDGRAYAFTDSRTTPSAIVVVAEGGQRREPIPLPLTRLPPAGEGISPYEPLQRWFAARYTWQGDRTGSWDIVPRASEAKVQRTTDPVEELFIDAETGYRRCFAPGNPHCIPGWEVVKDTEGLTGSCCDSPYTYAPAAPVTAFGARVHALSYRKTSGAEAGYMLVVDGTPAALATALEQRLRRRNVPFVRADRCAGLADSHEDCERQLRKTIRWEHPHEGRDTQMLWRILDDAQKHPVILTPTLAVGLYADNRGRTHIFTLARYALPAPSKGKAPRAPDAGRAVFHGE